MIIDTVERVFSTQFTAFRCGIAAVVKAVSDPARSGEFDPLQYVSLRLTRCEIVHVDFLPVGSCLILNNRNVSVILGCTAEGCRHGPIIAQRIGIQKKFIRPLERFANIPNTLVLQSVVFREKIPVTNFAGHSHLFIVVNRFKAIAQRRSPRVGGKMLLGKFNLGVDPYFGLFRSVIF